VYIYSREGKVVRTVVHGCANDARSEACQARQAESSKKVGNWRETRMKRARKRMIKIAKNGKPHTTVGHQQQGRTGMLDKIQEILQEEEEEEEWNSPTNQRKTVSFSQVENTEILGNDPVTGPP